MRPLRGTGAFACQLLSLLALSPPVFGQRAQLPRKGRQPETGAPRLLQPVRKLPRKTAAPAAVGGPSPLEQFITQQRRLVPGQTVVAEDRSRTLVRGTVRPLSPDTAMLYAPHVLPKLALIPVIRVTPPGVSTASAVPNRWYLFPSPPWRRYDDTRLDAIYAESHWWDPFNRNTIKGDFPFHGRREFFAFTGVSETLAEIRRLPVPSGASFAEPGEFGFFGRGGQFAVTQNFRFSMDLFRGSAGFRPVDWELRVTPEFNINYTLVRENGLINSDVRQSIRRTDSNVGMQELFLEKRLFSERAHFDFTSLRVGIQRFTSDFRGFIFSDEQPGARLFGTFHNNIFQYNLAYFNLLEKDTNSGLNRWRRRQQTVTAANLYWNDFLTKGYTLNFSALYNNDQPSFLVDKNGFLVRPAPIGGLAPPVTHKIRAAYAGIAGDGHIGRINVSHAFYQAFGRDDFNPIPLVKNPQHINAQLAAAEFSYEKDWMTYRVSAFYTSGDHKLDDGRANGFDAIVPNQQFAGGGFLGSSALADRGLLNNAFAAGGVNFLNREPIPLTGTAVTLFAPNNLMPTMRAGLFEGQANFINPGITLFNAGFDAKITPKLRSQLNVNWAKFNRTEVLQALLFQAHIRHAIGFDSGVGLQYRPLLSENFVITAGFGTLFPGDGFKDIYTSRTLFSGFINLRMVF
jgi:hypothetical protein